MQVLSIRYANLADLRPTLHPKQVHHLPMGATTQSRVGFVSGDHPHCRRVDGRIQASVRGCNATLLRRLELS